MKDLRIVAVAVEGSIDGGITKVNGSRAARRSNDLVRHVAVGTSNDYVEVFAPLAIVLCIVGSDGTSPENTPSASTIRLIQDIRME